MLVLRILLCCFDAVHSSTLVLWSCKLPVDLLEQRGSYVFLQLPRGSNLLVLQGNEDTKETNKRNSLIKSADNRNILEETSRACNTNKLLNYKE